MVTWMAKKSESKAAAMAAAFQVISKPGCHKCEDLKAWLTKNNVKFEEWSLESDEVKQKLVGDPKFTEKFCNIDGCMVYTPVIRLSDTGDYYFKEIFNQSGLRRIFLSFCILQKYEITYCHYLG